MRTLVTGGTGFVGLNIVEALLAAGDEVIVCGHAPLPAGAREALDRHAGRHTLAVGDIRDRAFVHGLFAGARVDRVVHAAVITAGREREASDPEGIFAVNVAGTLDVLRAARDARVGRIVYVSSGAVYGDSLFQPGRMYEEVTPARPSQLYPISKLAAERACLRLRELWGLDLACVRLGTVLGPWERRTGVRDPLSPHFQIAQAAVAGEEVVLPAREVRRDWVYSRDVAGGVLAVLASSRLRHGLYNLGSGVDWGDTLLPFCRRLAQRAGGLRFRVAAAGEQPTVFQAEGGDRAPMDIGRIRADTDYVPRHAGDAMFEDFAAWIDRSPAFWQASR